ncbi:DNA-binding transcriptional regulator BolA [Andreprevotia sp. IGB-42]|uniref:BolA family protein n=1 Tax=Andreprevotia sp. IGB-42 TaxID=2497473 RepID=UPI00135947BF|nr:BolA family protein [Andreprevotia sp. IGB-42]KAF0814947.1 DNA-binding transcriptional regulator BolA [Andreprevotia sp. IGB-42]
MSLEAEIRQRLASLSPESVDLYDDSAAHAGHAGNRGGGHYDLVIVAAVFAGQNALQRHRTVYGVLGDLIPDRVHALSVKAYAPGEL